MVNITKKYFAKKAVGVEVVKLYGSIELAPLVGLADCIVDIVETGNTMRENGLRVAEDIMDSSAHLIANKNSFYAKKEEILSLYEKIKEVVQSRA
jgi:ATP phosphoribosyltransferase